MTISYLRAAQRGPIAGALHRVAPAAALALGLTLAGSASAETILLTNAEMERPRLLDVEGFGKLKATAIQFDGMYGERKFTNLVAFCVDVYHDIRLGDYTPALEYTDEIAFTTDSHPTAPQVLTSEQVTHVGRLIHYGTQAFRNAPSDTRAERNARWNELAAVQGAIWQVTSGLDVVSENASLDGWINDLSGVGYDAFFNASYGPVGSKFTFLAPKVYPDPSGEQAYGTAVPEPAAWLMMILGFGGVGAVIRTRRRMALRPI